MKPTIFVASTSERADIEEALTLNLDSAADVSSWKQAFRPGQPIFSSLLDLKDRFDFAVIALTPDDTIQSRNAVRSAPRDNLVFELGLFIGSIGADRVFAIVDEHADVKVMSDYLGVRLLQFNSRRKDGDLNQALRPACVEIKQAMARVGPRRELAQGPSVFHGGTIGLERSYESMDHAEGTLLQELVADPGPIRLFFQIASRTVGIKGSLFDVVDAISQAGRVDIRILHASPESPLFARERLLAIGKRPDLVLSSLAYVNKSLRELEAMAASSLRRRTHGQPFLWRIYGLSERLYFMPYFSDSDAGKSSPVLVFKKDDRSLYRTFVDWFDYVWDKAAPGRVRLDELISPVAPSGSALFIEWDGYHVFGVPKRDIAEDSGQVRFYGLGGKRRSSSETFEDCAVREGNEETGGAIDGLASSPRTHYFRADETLTEIAITGERVVPRLVIEKRRHSGHGMMEKGDDSYFVVGYQARLGRKPTPTREIGALLYLRDEHLTECARKRFVSLARLRSLGAIVECQAGVTIPEDAMVVAHGTAAFLLRGSP